MLIKKIKSVLQVDLEGPIEFCHKFYYKIIKIWVNITKFKY